MKDSGLLMNGKELVLLVTTGEEIKNKAAACSSFHHEGGL